MALPSEFIIKFLEAYETYPCLWDVHSSLYKNRVCRYEAYQEVALMRLDGFGVGDVKAKCRSIRNAYAVEIGKINRTKHSGMGEEETYKPSVAVVQIRFVTN